MTSSPKTKCKGSAAGKATLAKALAPEEIRPGDFVTPLYVVAEVPSFFWCAESWSMPIDEPVRIRFTRSEGEPLRVCSVCVPFVLVKLATGEQKTLDLRSCQLARLDRSHARRAWKSLKKATKKKSTRATV